MRISRNRAIAVATAAALAITSVPFASANAAPASKPTVSQSTDFSAARRHRNYARGNQAFAGAMLGIIGAVGAYAAAREYRKAQQHRCGPYGCGAPYGAYGHPGYYGSPGPYYRY
jgi:hypothetical protein